ncbi:MAG: uroporphyrinogen-III C-methyltransferase [Polyangiaceae bacterium]|nr:uroporphyrinogen-III C-methyltransferase [Polyangiaceae bacterium]
MSERNNDSASPSDLSPRANICISAPPGDGGGARPGVVYLVGGGPGDPGLLTLRAAELLATADVVLHDELVHPAALEGARPGADLRPAGGQARQPAIEAELIAQARAGRSVVRLEGGDPFLFGRGSEEAEALARAGVPFEIVPGVCSPLGAAAYAGIPLTHRDLAAGVTLVSADPASGAPFDWSELASVRGTLCVLMGTQPLDAVAAALLGPGRRAPAAPAALIQWGTRAEQRVAEGPLADLPALARAAGLGAPAVLVVGPVAALRAALRWFDRRPLFGKRVLVTRAGHQAQATSRLVRRRGAEAIELPAIELHPPPDPARVTAAARALARYAVVAFTSENGVARFFAELDRQALDARAFGAARLAAIGPGTAAALAARGLRADIVPAEFRGETLAAAILADPVLARRLREPGPHAALIPRALVAREVLPDRLRRAGLEVDVVPVYETRPASAARREELIAALEAGRIDVVLLTSSSAADSIADLLAPRAPDLLSRPLVASIGPITTATAEKRGLPVGVTAEVSTLAGLLDAVERWYASQRTK